MEKVILTGDRPTGKLHIGHYVGSLRRRVELQNSGEYDKIFIMIADAQALTDNADNPEKIRQNVMEVAMDYLAAGLDPEKVNIFVQSAVPELTELAFYYMNLVSIARVQRNPTVKTEIEMRGFGGESIPTGFFCYPISQAADITLFHGTTVPAGEDQKPMIELTNEIVRRFNNTYGEVLNECQVLLPESSACRRLPGTDGKAKMSKSLGNCIYLSDTAKELKKKVNSMFTDPLHLNIEDPGHLSGTYTDEEGKEHEYQNTVFIYLDAFCEDSDFEKFLPEYKNLDEMKAHYCKGGLGDGTCKKFLLNILNDRLEPMRQRRAELEQNIEQVYEVLRKGTEAAREVGKKTLAEVRHAMKIDYFEDADFIKEQKKKYTK